jgi:hypothetical protein
MTLSDTSPAAHQVYFRRLAEMTPTERINMVVEMWQIGHSLQQAGMRQLYPEADEAEIVFQIAVTRFGAVLARKAYQRS